MAFFLYLDCDGCTRLIEFQPATAGARTYMLERMRKEGGALKLDRETGRYLHLCKECASREAAPTTPDGR